MMIPLGCLRVKNGERFDNKHCDSQPKLNTSLFGQVIPHPIFNASGPLCVTAEDLEALASSQASAILSKSCTLFPRVGNPLPRYSELPSGLGSINSMGLPNLGCKTYLEIFSGLRPSLQGRPAILSIAGLSIEENRELLNIARSATHLTAIELNLSCPNIPGKPQIAYDLDHLPELLELLVGSWPSTAPHLGVKLPPYFDPAHWDRVCETLNHTSALRFVTAINSPGNGLSFLPGTRQVSIAPKSGLGGIGGACIKPFALSNVRELRLRLRKEIEVIGCGGVTSGRDVLEHLLCGAQAVQVGTSFYEEGTSIFDRLQRELQEELSKLNFKCVDDARGQWTADAGRSASSADQYR